MGTGKLLHGGPPGYRLLQGFQASTPMPFLRSILTIPPGLHPLVFLSSPLTRATLGPRERAFSFSFRSDEHGRPDHRAGLPLVGHYRYPAIVSPFLSLLVIPFAIAG